MPARMKNAEATSDKHLATEQREPLNWPYDIPYLKDHTYSAAVTADQRTALSRTLSDDATWTKILPSMLQFPSHLVCIPDIYDEKHPAFGQRGLFAAQHLDPDAFVCLYLGHVHTNSLSDTDPHTDYDLSLDSNIGLSIDSAKCGNESRFANDYRGIAERPNAEFRDCFVQVQCAKRAGGTKWERRVGIFVLSTGKAGKRKAGIKDGEEVLVNYGKGFWEARKVIAGFRKDEVMLRIAELALDA